MPRNSPKTLAYRRVSIHESAVVVWVRKNWEKDSKWNGTNLGLFQHLLLLSRYVSSSAHRYVSPMGFLA